MDKDLLKVIVDNQIKRIVEFSVPVMEGSVFQQQCVSLSHTVLLMSS